MVSAAMDGYLDYVDYVNHPIFNLAIPAKCPGVPDSILQPQTSWTDQQAYEKTAWHLAEMFHKNFAKFSHMPKEVIASGPFALEKIKIS